MRSGRGCHHRQHLLCAYADGGLHTPEGVDEAARGSGDRRPGLARAKSQWRTSRRLMKLCRPGGHQSERASSSIRSLASAA